MSGGGRALAWAASAVAAIAGLALLHSSDGGGLPLLILAAAIVVGIVFEPRYRRGRSLPDDHLVDWRPSGERFVDPETGESLEVWIDPLTGTRRYAPIGADPRLDSSRTG